MRCPRLHACPCECMQWRCHPWVGGWAGGRAGGWVGPLTHLHNDSLGGWWACRVVGRTEEPVHEVLHLLGGPDCRGGEGGREGGREEGRVCWGDVQTGHAASHRSTGQGK
jgi:hypothetical protein